MHCPLWPFSISLSRLTPFLQLLSSVASSTQYSGARCMAWRHTAHQFFLHPRTRCPSGCVLPVCYYFTWLTGTPLDPSSAHPVFTTSFFQFNPHFLPSHKHYCVSSAVPPKQLTSLQQLGCPIFFLSETVDFLLSLVPTKCLPAISTPITHPVSSSQYPAPPEPCQLISVIFSSFQTIITLSLASSANSCFCGNPSTSSCVSAILLFLGRNPSLGSTKREKWEAARHLLQAGDRKTTRQEVHCVVQPSDLHPTLLQMFFLVPWIWWWGGCVVKGICVLKLWDVLGCMEIIK